MKFDTKLVYVIQLMAFTNYVSDKAEGSGREIVLGAKQTKIVQNNKQLILCYVCLCQVSCWIYLHIPSHATPQKHHVWQMLEQLCRIFYPRYTNEMLQTHLPSTQLSTTHLDQEVYLIMCVNKSPDWYLRDHFIEIYSRGSERDEKR